jgi:hypothetical protein
MRNYFCAFLLLVSFLSFSQIDTPPQPPGCKVYWVIDEDNDGFASFDINYYIETYFRNIALLEQGYDLSGYQLLLYPSELDYNNDTNVIGSSYTNIVANYQFCYLKYIYIGGGPEYPDVDLAYYSTCQVLETIPFDGDEDNDGVINVLEDLNNNGILLDDNTDGNGNLNFNDTDDDDDGILTIDEDSNNNGNYLDDDDNNNGIPNYLDAISLNTVQIDMISFSITPNPASKQIDLIFDFNWNEKYDWSILDLAGKTILQFKDADEKAINISSLQSGLYFLKVVVGSKATTRKFIKQ